MKFINKKVFLFLIFSLFFVTGFLVFNNLASAQTSSLDLGLAQAAATGLPSTDIRTIIAKIIKAALGLLGVVALCLVLYAGYLWMTAGGDDEKIGTSKKILINATIGLVIILSAYSIVSFVMNKLVEATGGGILTKCQIQINSGGNSYGGNCPPSGGGCLYDCDGKFKISTMPAGGDVCIRNVAPAIVFNREVDLDTVQNKIIVVDSSAPTVAVVGTWSWQSTNHNIIYFKPSNGACPAPDNGKDCFASSTTYILMVLANGAGIQSVDGKNLDCNNSTGKCTPVFFTTGDGVDRQKPVINFIYPKLVDSDLMQSSTINVQVHFTDDGGLQNLSLNADGNFVGSQNLSGCTKTDTITIPWPTNKLTTGIHNLKAIGLDWAANSGEASSQANLKPAHCFNNALNSDLGEKFVDCGGECGVCSGDKCVVNEDCTSGYCYRQTVGTPEGVCVNKTYITNFSPSSGAIGDYISITGKNFGSAQGHVYFANISSPSTTIPSNWTEAFVVNCGAGFNNWSDNQIIVSVPVGATSSKIAVFNANAIGVNSYDIRYFDTTGNGFKNVPNFILSTTTHPGICALDPNHGTVGSDVTVHGKNFGASDAVKSFVTFSDNTKAQITSWTNAANALVNLIVPTSLGNGEYGVRLTNNSNQKSNSVLFTVAGSNQDAPIISDISAPASPAIGDYLTITGKNFGNQTGVVWFKLNGSGTAVNGNTNFPVACKNSVWKDNQVIIKIPGGLNTSGDTYTIQVKNSETDLNSVLDNSKIVKIYNGQPSPGICEISPVSGKVPFLAPNLLTVSGEYLNNVSKFYFWKTGGASNNITSTLVGVNVLASSGGNSLTTFPSSTVANVTDIASGLVYAYRGSDQKQSNGLLFTTNDCTKNGCASSNDNCCMSGSEMGSCKPKGELCAGVFKNSGFVWMFSTKEIIPPPQVVERCDNETEAGTKLPSPSPSTKWNVPGHEDANKVCQTALITVEFTSDLASTTINNTSVVVNSCSGIGANGACIVTGNITLTADSFVKKYASVGASQNVRPYLSLKPQVGGTPIKWVANQLYQVVLKNTITSPQNSTGASSALLATNSCGNGTSYCFTFKTGVGDCVLKQVVITPTNFWAKYLESPMRYHTTGGDVYDVFYHGNGLSDQYCTMMDMTGYNWQWGINNKNVGKTYAQIFGVGTGITTQVITKANTVGVGVANDSVNVMATATQANISKSGSSPLTIDLSKPEVVEYWPNCLEACTNAAVGVRFNVNMANVNVNYPAIKLQECTDENCLSVSSSIALTSSFDAASGNTILKIANDGAGGVLQPNTLYKVTLSATSSSGSFSNDQLWSANDSSNFASSSKPYNKIFTWRFRTKKEACKVDRISILPKVFTASKLKDLAVFQAQPYAAPDACSAAGQKLNPWSQNWDWTSSVPTLATVQKFQTKGSGAYCTATCILKGSTVPSGQNSSAFPICGNGKIEAGEDCDAPNFATGCGLNCKFLGNLNTTTTASATNINLCGDGFVSANKGEACDPKNTNTQVGCSNICLRTGSKMQTAAENTSGSICGNGMIGSGEDCDLGISPNQNISTSSMFCSSQCLHLGTRLSSQWCFDHSADFGGFIQKDYNFFCNQSYSQCGDGVTSPDEDSGCEFTDNVATGKHKDWCDNRCLKITTTHNDTGCTANQEGCDENAQHVGSSLMYIAPSICGDGVGGTGEDAVCETAPYLTNLWHKDSVGGLLYDPWVLAIGQVGLAGQIVSTTVTAQTSDITGSITVASKTVNGVGKYQVLCGYKTDQDCQAAYSGNLNVGVGNNSCCYFKSKLVGVYPGNTSTAAVDVKQNVCVNTFIEADFDSVIDSATLPGNFIIARSATAACAGGLEDVSTSTSLASLNDSSLPWYKNLWNKIVVSVKNLFGYEVSATTWCAGADIGGVQVVKDDTGGSKVLFSLSKPLATTTDYVVILKKGIKNVQGISIESDAAGKAIGWRFKTGAKICEISGVSIDPDQYYFSVPNASVSMVAKGVTAEDNQLIQPVSGYSWNYVWGPKNNPYVLVASTTSSINVITSQNNNGELDVHAAANITENLYTKETGLVATGKSHVIVFICEHPWPPKSTIVPGQTSSTIIFPYEDKTGNNDGFDLATNIFNNTAIVAANVGTGYFNFSTYYCADNGEHGYADDLPYMRPAVQTAANTQGMGAFVNTGNIAVATTYYVTSTVAATSTCANNPAQACTVDNDCGVNKIVKNNGTISFAATSTKSGVCAVMATNAANATRYVPRQQGANLTGPAFSCTTSADCNTSLYAISWYLSIPGWNYNTWFDCLQLSSVPSTPISTCVPHTQVISTPVTTTTIQATNTSTQFSVFKRFIFTSDKNNDAIGIQIISNPKHLSPRDWYGSQNFEGNLQDIKVDGYEAVTDGNNIYISALNFDQSTVPGHGNLYTNIYLFSVNDNATQETKKVFESLIKNLKFNINLTNYGYCGVNMNNPGDTTQCVSDFDCVIGEVCSVQKDKLKRNFQRVKDMSKIERQLNTYKNNHSNTYPDLSAGTYLSGQTVSTWPSWSLLSNAVGTSIPTDPINKLGTAGTCSSSTGQFCLTDANCGTQALPETCVLHDPITAWSTADKRFSFACTTSSLAYRFFATSTSPTSSNYLVKFRFEDAGITIDNSDALVANFISNLSHFSLFGNNQNGICSQNNEITTMNQGTCGDGKINLNKNELCDPPGGVVWNQAACNAIGATSATVMPGLICANDCKATTATNTTCGILAKCSNGKVEVGEFCDEGSLNGKYNHCNLSCTALTSSCGDGSVTLAYEVCDTKAGNLPNSVYDGWCVGGVRNQKICSDNAECNNGCISPSWSSNKLVPLVISDFNTNASGNPVCSGGMLPVTSVTGVCNTQISSSSPKYGMTSGSSCAFDCQKSGPYCGDKIVQPEFGEECDGSEICSINGIAGNRVCDIKCHWQNQSAIVRYNFDNVLVFGNSYVMNSASNTAVGVAAYCSGGGGSGCPVAAMSENINKKQAMYFDGVQDYFKIDHQASFDINELTISTWINVDVNSSDDYHAILSKEAPGSGNRDYNFYVVKNANKVNQLHFASNVFGYSTVPVDFRAGEWHFVGVTVNQKRQTKYYVDGNFVGEGIVTNSTTLKANNNYPIFIGRSANWFQGSMDELQLYGRALEKEEIKDLYENSQNFCEAKIALIAQEPVVSTGCNNGKVDADEACDNGALNGVTCTPGYNKSCTYCLAGCKNTKTVEAVEYCGDGVVNGEEKCDVDSSSNTIFSISTTTGSNNLRLGTSNSLNSEHKGYQVSTCEQEYNLSLNASSQGFYDSSNWANLTTKIGSKACINNCSGISNKCIECGLKTGGSVVSGSLINVLEPELGNPLMAVSGGANGHIGLLYTSTAQATIGGNTVGVADFTYGFGNNTYNYTLHPLLGNSAVAANINNDPVCSDNSQSKIYRLAINAGLLNDNLIDFPVFGTTTPDKYNLLLSPVIIKNSLTHSDHHVRVVISWVDVTGIFGIGQVDEFNAGFTIPGGTPVTLEDTSFFSTVGLDYYNNNNLKKSSIWYHGFKNANTSNVESFTIDTLNMSTSSYAFYVKTSGSPIKNFKNSAKLKVEIYLPGDDIDPRHFARPVKTYYLNQSIPSDNAAAQYWHVFNVKKVPFANDVVTSDNGIKDINMIQSFIKMNYAQ